MTILAALRGFEAPHISFWLFTAKSIIYIKGIKNEEEACSVARIERGSFVEFIITYSLAPLLATFNYKCS